MRTRKVRLKNLSSINTECFEIVVFSFRGTIMNSVIDWLHDLSIGFSSIVQGDSAQVHSGFLHVFQSHEDFIFPVIPDLIGKYPDYDFVATGHSMGGSSATLLAFDLFKNYGINKTRLVTFGSPRVGNAQFRSEFSASGISSWRVTNMNDIVPHLPLRSEGFVHIPTEIFQTSTTGGAISYKVCNDQNNEDPSCSANQKFLGIQDHEHYMGIFSGLCSNVAHT